MERGVEKEGRGRDKMREDSCLLLARYPRQLELAKGKSLEPPMFVALAIMGGRVLPRGQSNLTDRRFTRCASVQKYSRPQRNGKV